MEKVVENVRVGGKEPRSVTVRELTNEEDERCVRNSLKEVTNPVTGQKDKIIDTITVRKQCIITACGLSEEEYNKTPRKDAMRLSNAFSELNDLSDDEKRGSAN